MTDNPNPDDFSFYIDETDYRVTLRIRGEVNVSVKANSKDEARDKAEEFADKMAEDVLEIELDDVDDINVSYIQAPQKMYRVIRDGKSIRTSRLKRGDTPRDPDERGF